MQNSASFSWQALKVIELNRSGKVTDLLKRLIGDPPHFRYPMIREVPVV